MTRLDLENDGAWVALAVLAIIIGFFMVKDRVEQYRLDHSRNQAHPMRHWEVPRR